MVRNNRISSLKPLLQGEKRGQALVLLAVAFFALLAFLGLVTDVGSIYISYTSLQRAIDAAAVAAANNIKNPQTSLTERKQKITEAAREMLTIHRITGVSDLQVYLCSDDPKPAKFAAMCPASGQSPRKLAYIEATQDSPVYFLQIFGVRSFPLHASAVGETAAVDLVLVFDTSESMGKDTAGYNPNDFNPATCNSNNNCYPFRQAKDAAAVLVENLFDGYDQVGIVTFDYQAHQLPIVGTTLLSTDLGDKNNPQPGTVQYAIRYGINLHDDLATMKVKWAIYESPWGDKRNYNPIYPEDRDGDGKDADAGKPCVDQYVNLAGSSLDTSTIQPDQWADADNGLSGSSHVAAGDPCDSDTIIDAIDWNADGVYSQTYGIGDATIPVGYDNPNSIPPSFESSSLLSTCSGCGLRAARELLAGGGRAGAVWVIVYLSDGIANLSDMPATNSDIDSDFIYGFCGNDPAIAFWPDYCIDWNNPPNTGRYCIDNNANECPPTPPALPTPIPPFPGVIVGHTTTSGPYSVEDYAFDMADRAGLLFSTNPSELSGDDIVMFSVGLGAASAGETLLRYIANIGDDGSRGNDPCASIVTMQNCGNYYYAPTGAYLSQIFENIAGRIFTKISR